MKRNFIMLLLCLWAFRPHAQVNLQTGSATFSLPVFNWQDSKSRLNGSVSLLYNSGGGLKTNEVAGPAGQGWALFAGGVITRLQAGEPDDQKPNNGSGIGDLQRYPPGFLYNSVTPAAGCPLPLRQYPIYPDRNHLYKPNNDIVADREMDQFSFQFNGKSGTMVVSKYLDSNGRHKCYFLGDTKMLAACELDESSGNPNRTTIVKFYITDESGLVYVFDVMGKAKVMRSQYTDPSYEHVLDNPKFKKGKTYHESNFDDPSIVKPWIVNSWFLSEIRDPFTSAKIKFTYQQRTIQAQREIGITYSGDQDYIMLSRKFAKSVGQDISTISYPDGHTVVFTYGDETRADLPGAYPLASINVRYLGRTVSMFNLKTSYFILNRYGTPKTDFEKRFARLCLRKVTKYSSNRKSYQEPYIFDYYIGGTPGWNPNDDVVPPPYSPIKDIWGYYNGNQSRSTWGDSIDVRKDINTMTTPELIGLCFNRDVNPFPTLVYNPKAGYARNGLLRQIVYPTGGAIGYEYEQNEGYIGSNYQTVGGVHVSRTKVTDGGYANGCDNPIVTNYKYVDESGTHSSMWGLETPINQTYFQSHWEPEEKKIRLVPFSLRCQFTYKNPGIQSREQATSPELDYYILTAAGFGLDVLMTVNNVKDVIASLQKGTSLMGSLLGAAVQVLLDLAISCLSNPSKDMVVNTIYSYDLNGANPLPAQFRRVVVEQAGGGNGKTVHEFTSDTDYPLWLPADQNTFFSSEQRFASWAYGLPKMTTVFDSVGGIVKRVYNDYGFGRRCNSRYHLNASVPDTSTFLCTTLKTALPLTSVKCHLTANQSQRSDEWETPDLDTTHYLTSSIDQFTVHPITFYSGRTELDYTYEWNYKQGDSTKSSKSITMYTYNTNNYQVATTRVVQSNGDISVKSIKYNDEFSNDDFPKLTAKNIYGVPVNVITAVQIASNYLNTYILSEQVTEFDELANGDVKPIRAMEQRTASPVAYGSWKFYTEPGAVFTTTQTMKYDAAGNMIGVVDEGGRSVSNIYGYNDRLVVASVINAEPSTDKPAYTSFESGAHGGWTVGSYSASTSSVTGAKSAVFVSNTATAPVNSAKEYLVSFWSTATLSVSGGAVLELSAPTVNGFTFYQYRVPAGNTSLTVSGSATIDELRLYPANARMRTVAYDELVGKTEDCDENNRVTHYVYDELDRMRFIKDENGNVLKMYEYAVAIKKKGCIPSFTNPKIIEYIAPNNCGEHQLGKDTVFVIAAGTYTADTQEELDQKIEEALSGIQAWANANGSCTQLYGNDEMSDDFDVEVCALGDKAPPVTYTVPANTYWAVSKTTANELAADDVFANGPGYANRYALTNGSCVTDTEPIWEAADTSAERCEQVSGYYTGYIEKLAHNVNPNVTVADQYKRFRADSSCNGYAYYSYTNYDPTEDYEVIVSDTLTGHVIKQFLLNPTGTGTVDVGTALNGTYNVEVRRVVASSVPFSVNIYTPLATPYKSGVSPLVFNSVPIYNVFILTIN